MSLSRTALVAPVALLASLAACNLPKGEPEPLRQTVVLTITGMTSAERSPPLVEDALESVTGVESARVDFAARTATVVYLGRFESEELLEALRERGFGAAAH